MTRRSLCYKKEIILKDVENEDQDQEMKFDQWRVTYEQFEEIFWSEGFK